MVKQLKIKILVNAFVLWYDGLHEKNSQDFKNQLYIQ